MLSSLSGAEDVLQVIPGHLLPDTVQRPQLELEVQHVSPVQQCSDQVQVDSKQHSRHFPEVRLRA